MLTSLVLPRDMELRESSRDGQSESFQERLTEVSERLLVLDHGIQPQLNGLVLELVNTDTSTELNSTTKSTELDQEQSTELKTTLTVKMT